MPLRDDGDTFRPSRRVYEPDSNKSLLNGGGNTSPGPGPKQPTVQDTINSGPNVTGGAGGAGGGGKPRPPQQQSGLMDYATWEGEAKKNAAKAGHTWNPNEGQSNYDAYVWHSQHPTQQTTSNYDAYKPPGEQQSTARLPAGTFPDDSPDAGNWHTGDSYLDELRSGSVAGAEDWRRFSNAQLKAWEPFYLGNGQFKNKYGDIVGKPPDRGPNTPAGVNGLGVSGNYGGGGGGGGAPGGAAPGGQAPGAPGAGGANAPPAYNYNQNYVTGRNPAGAGVGGGGVSTTPGNPYQTAAATPGTPGRGQPGGVAQPPRYVTSQSRAIPGGTVVGTPITRTGM